MLLDTTLLIDFLRGKKEAVEILARSERQQFYTTEINIFEIVFGIYAKRQNPEKDIEKAFALFSKLIILALERRGTIKAGEIGGMLMKRGLQIEQTDCLIAGIALSNGIPEIITANKTHFERIPEIKVVSY